MDIKEILDYTFKNNCSITFAQELNMLSIVVTKDRGFAPRKFYKQVIPLDHHTNGDTILNIIKFCVNALSEF